MTGSHVAAAAAGFAVGGGAGFAAGYYVRGKIADREVNKATEAAITAQAKLMAKEADAGNVENVVKLNESLGEKTEA